MTNLPLLYIDEAIIVADKPSGLLSIPDGYQPDLENCLAILQQSYGKLFVTHRLDKDTSGILVFARSAEAHQIINSQFQNRHVKKVYLAWVSGEFEQQQIEVSTPLRVNADRKHRTLPDPQRGKPAGTQVRLLESRDFGSFVAAYPSTGYTHQIRSHLAFINHPVLFDPLYNPLYKPQKNGRTHSPEQRLMLHSYQLQFAHPASLHNVIFTAPIPADFLPPLCSTESLL